MALTILLCDAYLDHVVNHAPTFNLITRQMYDAVLTISGHRYLLYSNNFFMVSCTSYCQIPFTFPGLDSFSLILYIVLCCHTCENATYLRLQGRMLQPYTSSVKSLWLSDIIWRRRSGSISSQLVAFFWWHKAIAWASVTSHHWGSLAWAWADFQEVIEIHSYFE